MEHARTAKEEKRKVESENERERERAKRKRERRKSSKEKQADTNNRLLARLELTNHLTEAFKQSTIQHEFTVRIKT